MSLQIPQFPPESRIEVVESSPELMVIRLHPTGWRWSYGVFLAVLAVPVACSGIPLCQVLLDWWTRISNSRVYPIASATFTSLLGIIPLAVLFWVAYLFWRFALEWTQLRIESGRVTVTRPTLLGATQIVEFPLERVSTHGGAALFNLQTIRLEGGGRKAVCGTPLRWADLRRLMAVLNERITREVGHGSQGRGATPRAIGTTFANRDSADVP